MRFGAAGLGLFFGGLALFLALLIGICLYGVRHARTPATQSMELTS
jgi:hypothetical protein